MSAYDYGNARLRAMKSRLIDRRGYQELCALTSLDSLIARLAQSVYGQAIEAALARHTGARVVMEACRQHLASTLKRVRELFTGAPAKLVSVLLARWDLHNLRTILRGQEAGANPDALLEALVPAGELDENALRNMVRQARTAAATADLLKIWNVDYAQSVRAAAAVLSRTHDWMSFEITLDSIFYERLRNGLSLEDKNEAMVALLLAREIDAVNLITALRLQQAVSSADPDLTRYFLKGGGMKLARLVRIAQAANDAETLQLLQQTGLAGDTGGGERLDLTIVQRGVERALASFAYSFFRRDPLTIALAIAFIAAQIVEAANVRLLAQGLLVGMTRAEIEKNLIVF